MERALCLFILLFAVLPWRATQCFGQDNPWVIWDFKAVPLSKTEVTLLITASLAPRWHIYSQHLAAGGPQPTRITYEEDSSYQASGNSQETGNHTQFYSDLFEMYIEWYSGTVTFSQQVTVYEPVTVIRGEIEYMTCNNEVCVPAKREFTFAINLLKPRQ